MIKATIKLLLDGQPLSNGKYAVYIRILKDRKAKKISLGLQCKKEHFVNESFTKQHPEYQTENVILLKMKTRALEIIREFKADNIDFSLNEFEELFRGVKQKRNISVVKFFDEIIDEMLVAGRIKNAKAYRDTKATLTKFKGVSFSFKDITPAFLEKYESFLRGKGYTNGGIAFHMRELRALFNKARTRKMIPKDPYPFEDYKISRLRTKSVKIALSVYEFKKIKNVDLSEHPQLVEAHNYFMFSIYTRGFNFQDMAQLKWSNIRDGRIYYTRSKTKGNLNLAIIPPVQKILDYYKAQNRPTDYVFPILLREGLTPQQIANRKHKVLKRYNSKLKDIAKLAKVEKKLTSYVARHSFATLLKLSGTPIEKISEMMGHADVATTITYLKEFSNDDLDKENMKFLSM